MLDSPAQAFGFSPLPAWRCLEHGPVPSDCLRMTSGYTISLMQPGAHFLAPLCLCKMGITKVPSLPRVSLLGSNEWKHLKLNGIVSKHSIKHSSHCYHSDFLFSKALDFYLLDYSLKKKITLETRTGEQEFFPGSCLMESKNEASDERHSNKAGVYYKQTRAPLSGGRVQGVAPQSFLLFSYTS